MIITNTLETQDRINSKTMAATLPSDRTWWDMFKDCRNLLVESTKCFGLIMVTTGFIILCMYIIFSFVLACSWLGKFMAAPMNATELWPAYDPTSISFD